MAASVEELFDARRQLVAWASHDLRTPLASMQAMLEAVEDGLVEPERYVPALKQQVDALRVLVDDLFELARLDAGVLSLELREAPLAGVVRSALGGLEAEAEARHVALAARIDGDPTAICAPDKVERVLLNLLTNAIRHTPSDGSVAVIVEPLDGEVRVSVEDTGEGHPAGLDQARLRPLLARRPLAHERDRRRGPRPGDRARPRRGAGRPDLGGERRRRRRPGLVHAAAALSNL